MRKAGRVESLGRHQLLVELARGGMGIVHLAVVEGPAGFSKLVVIKELPSELSAKHELVEMFLEEARIGARLNHPNIVQTNEVGSEGDRHFLVMEYLEGQSLRTLLKAVEGGPRLPPAVHLHILIDALAGLHHAHELTDFSGRALNVVHRDVSPHNLFVTYAGVTKVVDFGLARASDTLRNTGSGVLRGKLGYMAPEHFRGSPIDRRADIFSVGVMLWEALAGRRMWRGLTEIAVAHMLAAGDIPSLRQAEPSVPEELVRICDRALAPDGRDRFATAREMQAVLESYQGLQGKHATPRGVGTLLAELFREDRERVDALIAAQLDALRTYGARAEMVSLVEPERVSSAPRIWVAPTPGDGLLDDPSPTERFPVVPGAGDPSTSSLSSLSPMNASRPPKATTHLPLHASRWAAGASLLLAGVGLGLAGARAAHVPSPNALAATSRQDLESVRLTVHTNPPNARILLDEAPRGEGSLDVLLPKDSRRHTLRVEADGFVSVSEQLVVSERLEVRVFLERIAKR